jgi:UDP-glucose/galactose:(glucosyl)LPS alpha-1,2-glucosyl/galactosyltransferase
MTGSSIVVMSSTDERYVMPLTVMVRSMLENLAAGTPVNLYIFQDGVSAASRRCAEDSWEPFPVRTHWVRPEMSEIRRRLRDRGFTGPPAAYFRLLAGELLPPEVTKVIYLDADIVVMGDLSGLWNVEMNGNLAMAVPDAYAKAFHLGRISRVMFSEEIRFDLQTPYFNTGVLLIDVEGWRREKVGERTLRLLADYRKDLRFYDQDALNCALQGRCGVLDLTWNFHELPDCLFLWDASFYRKAGLQEATPEPQVVHFIARAKPWMARCFYLKTDVFRDYFSRTRWPECMLQGQSGLAGLVQALLVMPHSRLNQLVWRKSASADRANRFCSVLPLLATHPWMLVTYPLWQVLVWLYLLLFMPVDRRDD